MILAILQARMSSSRLSGKVMKPILERPMMGLQLERIWRARTLDQVVVATSTDPSDDVIAEFCRGQDVAFFRGSLNNVLRRFLGAAYAYGPPEHVVRLTADCPLADWTVIDDCVRLHVDGGYDFTSNAMYRTFPDGLDVEVLTMATLERIAEGANTPKQEEHVTQFVYDFPEKFSCGHLLQDCDQSQRRWTVDDASDFALAKAVYTDLYPANPAFTTKDIIAWQDTHPNHLFCSPPVEDPPMAK